MAIRTPSQSGNWNATSTWGENPVPTSSDIAWINNFTVTITDQLATCRFCVVDGTLANPGTLKYSRSANTRLHIRGETGEGGSFVVRGYGILDIGKSNDRIPGGSLAEVWLTLNENNLVGGGTPPLSPMANPIPFGITGGPAVMHPTTAPTIGDGGAGNVNTSGRLIRYRVSFVSALGESAMGPVSSAQAFSNRQVSITSIPTGPGGTTARKIYRQKTGNQDTAGKWGLVATISDNVTTSFTDNVLLANLGSMPVNFYAPFDTGVWVMENGSIYGHGAQKDRWTKLHVTASAGHGAPGGTAIQVKNLYTAGWGADDELLFTATHLNTAGTDQNETRILGGPLTNLGGGVSSLLFKTGQTGLTNAHEVRSRAWTDGFLYARTTIMAGEVANLTCNVTISSRTTGGALSTTDRGHVMFMDSGKFYLEGVRFENLGPLSNQDPMGRYSIHSHRQEEGSRGSYLRYCVLTANTPVGGGYFQHESYGIEVLDTVAYKIATSTGNRNIFNTADGQKATCFNIENTKDPTPGSLYENGIYGTGIRHGADHSTWDRLLTCAWGEGISADKRNTGYWLGGTKWFCMTGCVAAGSFKSSTDGSGFEWPDGGLFDGIHGTHVFRIEAHSNVRDGLFARQNALFNEHFEPIIDVLSWRNGDYGIRWGAYVDGYHQFFVQAIGNGLVQLQHTTSQRRVTNALADSDTISGGVGIEVSGYFKGSSDGVQGVFRGDSVYRLPIMQNNHYNFAHHEEDPTGNPPAPRGNWTSGNENSWVQVIFGNFGAVAAVSPATNPRHIFFSRHAGDQPAGTDPSLPGNFAQGILGPSFDSHVPSHSPTGGGTMDANRGSRVSIFDQTGISGYAADFVMQRPSEPKYIVGMTDDDVVNAKRINGQTLTDATLGSFVVAKFPKPAKVKFLAPTDDSLEPAEVGGVRNITITVESDGDVVYVYNVTRFPFLTDPVNAIIPGNYILKFDRVNAGTWSASGVWNMNQQQFDGLLSTTGGGNSRRAYFVAEARFNNQTEPDAFTRLTRNFSEVVRVVRPLISSQAEPVAPSLSSFTSGTPTSVTWAHNDVSDETGYEYYAATSASGPWDSTTLRSSKAPGSTGETWSGASPSTTYWGRVAAVGVSQTRYLSNTISVATADTVPAAPINPQFTSVTQTTLNFSVTDNSTNETGFDAQYRTPPGSGGWTALDPDKPASSPATSTGSSITWAVTGLTAGTLYEFQAWSKNGAGNSAIVTAQAQTSALEPIAPTFSDFNILSSTSLQWIHTDVTNEQGYEYQFKKTADSGWTIAGSLGQNQTSATFTVPTIEPNTSYDARVASIGTSGTRYFSSVLSETSPQTVPAAPINPTPLNITQNTADIRVTDNSTNESGFDAQYRVVGAGSWTALGPDKAAEAGTGTLITWSLSGLTASTDYEAEMWAKNSAGDSTHVPLSFRTSDVPPPPEPTAPVLLTATALNPTTINATWTNVTDELGYEWQAQRLTPPADADYITRVSVAANDTDENWTGASPNTQYSIRIRAVGPTTNPESNVLIVTTPIATPATPTAPRFANVAQTSLEFIVTDASGAAGDPESTFKARYRTPPGSGGWTNLTDQPAQPGTGAAIVFPVTGLIASTTYEFQAQATNATGDSAFTSAQVTTTAVSEPTAPTLNTLTSPTPTSLSWGWSDVANEQGYEIQTSPAGAQNPSFESGDTGWFKESGWTIVNDAGNAFVGTWAGKKDASAQANAALRANNSVPAVATTDQVYFAEGYFKPSGSPDGTAYVRLSWRNALGVEFASSAGNVVPATATAYTRSTIVATAPAGTFGVVPEFVVDSHTAGTWYVDSIAFGLQQPDPFITRDVLAVGAVSGTWSSAVPLTAYQGRVRAIGTGSNRFASNILTITTGAVAPTAPSAPRFASVQNTSLTFQVTDMSGNAGDPEASFKGRYRTVIGPGSWVNLTDQLALAGTGGTVNFPVTGLTADTDYEFEAWASNATGDSAHTVATQRTATSGGSGGSGETGPAGVHAVVGRIASFSQFTSRIIFRFWSRG